MARYKSKPGSLMNVSVGMRPFGPSKRVPMIGKKPTDEPDTSRCTFKYAVRLVSALGLQVMAGANRSRSSGTKFTWVSLSRVSAIIRYSRVPSSFSGPVKSSANCLRPYSPSCTPTSPACSRCGRLLTIFTRPPKPPWPYSTDEGPFTTSTRSRVNGSGRTLL